MLPSQPALPISPIWPNGCDANSDAVPANYVEARTDRRRALHPRHHHVFDLDIFFHAVTRAFAAKAAFLDAAEGRDFRGDETGVDADHAGLQRFGDAPDAAEIGRASCRERV